MQKVAENDLKELDNTFRKWLEQFMGEETKNFNLSSASQKQHLLFAPCIFNNIIDCNKYNKSDYVPRERTFSIENTEGIIMV